MDESFALPPDFRVDEVLRDGRAFQSDVAPRPLVVRYGPAVARWIAEREGGTIDEDGSVTVTHPLADVDWAMRHVLQYGADAEVLAPIDVRDAVARRLDAMLGEGAAG